MIPVFTVRFGIQLLNSEVIELNHSIGAVILIMRVGISVHGHVQVFIWTATKISIRTSPKG